GGPGAGDDAAVVDVEHVRVDLGPGCDRGEPVREHPVGGAATAVEEPCRGEHERAGAQREDPGAAGVGVADGLEVGGWDLDPAVVGDDVVGDHDDDVGVGG